MKPIKINKKSIKSATSFAFDGCHKVYLLKGQNDINDAKKYGYTIYPIDELEEIFYWTCSLRFINWWFNLDTIVPQFAEKVEFRYSDGTKSILDFTTEV